LRNHHTRLAGLDDHSMPNHHMLDPELRDGDAMARVYLKDVGQTEVMTLEAATCDERRYLEYESAIPSCKPMLSDDSSHLRAGKAQDRLGLYPFQAERLKLPRA
jgi:hypothetical protein